MIVDTAEFKCTIEVLSFLSKTKISKYNDMFRFTKVSHTTLQKVLSELEEKKFIKKNSLGRLNTTYEITDKGKNLLIQLENINGLLDWYVKFLRELFHFI